jgi:hypothetical protein
MLGLRFLKNDWVLIEVLVFLQKKGLGVIIK